MKPSRLPFLLLPVIALALITGIWAGLGRMGWAALATPILGPMLHGPLMVGGFLGTLITLERAVALGKLWCFGAPVLSAAATLILLLGGNITLVAIVFTLAAVIFVAVNGVIVHHQPALFTAMLLLGGATWLLGNGVWLTGRPLHQIVLLWACFLIFTIAGERLELSRVRRLDQKAHLALGVVVLLLGLSSLLALVWYAAAVRLFGVGLFTLGLWLAYYDIARRTMRQPGLTRYIALCLFSGYIWLMVGGVLALIAGGVMAGLWYDAFLHSVFVGFVFSMVFGHAPIIFPSLTNWQMTYAPRFYGPLLLLHGSLILRMVGNVLPSVVARQWGGLLNGIAILFFLGNIAYSVGHAAATSRT